MAVVIKAQKDWDDVWRTLQFIAIACCSSFNYCPWWTHARKQPIFQL